MNHLLNSMLRKGGFTLLLLASFTSSVLADPDVDTKKSTIELEALRDQIQKIKKDIDSRRDESKELRDQLEQSESEVEKAIKEAKALDEKIRKQNEAIEALKKKQSGKAEALNQHKSFLMKQMRVAYINKDQSTLKLVLNQEDSSAISRHMVYHRYFTEARKKKITQVSAQISELQQHQKVIMHESEQLRLLQFSKKENLQALEQKKQKRQQVIVQLDEELFSKNEMLGRMKNDAENLNVLLQSLDQAAAKIARLAKIERERHKSPPFVQLKGKLRWPAAGGIIHRYGTSRNNSSLSWQGMLIDAPVGSDVKAVSHGRVIFSDWFQNLGRLIIVDHGGGYMSLYGHNSQLLRAVGDKVETGEVIASVGDTGGRKNSGLYFEVRQKGTPVNPGIWCKGQFR